MTTGNISVLILIPNPLQSDLVRITLQRHKMRPIICDEPSDLRKLLIDHTPDFLLIDTYLPGQNGLELLSQLQAEAVVRKTRVFVVSSMGFPEIVQKAARVGASGFFIKPLDTELLVKRILSAMGQPGSQAD